MQLKQKKIMRKRLKNAMEFIFWAAATFLLLHAAVFSIPQIWGMDTYVVTSGSMEPTISKGSVVFVDTDDRTPEVGKVITFHATEDPESMVVTHRIYEVKENGECITKGDANQSVDLNSVTPQQIIGSDAWTIGGLGYIASSPLVKAVPAILLVISGSVLIFL